MTTDDLARKIIKGETVYCIDKEQKKEMQIELRKIKKNCTIVLSQLKEQLKQ